MKHYKINLLIITGILIIFALIGFIIAIPSFGSDWGTTNHVAESESPLYSYNFSSNVTDLQNGIWTFSILGVNSTLYPSQQQISFYNWISINASTGIMTINSTKDNQTGRFNLSVQVLDQSTFGESKPFYFIVNATNDFPNFTNIQPVYNFSQDTAYLGYINASDEEGHYPLRFNMTFINNCTHSSWWNGTGSCDLFTATNSSNTSILMNFTPVKNDVGVYFANISVMDFGANYNCSSGYCLSDYSQNKTTYYSQIIIFNVYSLLGINASDCQNKVFQENASGSCVINITTKGSDDSINISSNATVRNYQATVSNSSWFYAPNLTSSVNYTRSINVSFTPQATEIGNWTINFSVKDIIANQNLTEQIYIYVNRTSNKRVNISSISNVNTSINYLTRINISAYDDDFLIPDKFQGYNESLNFSVVVLNLSDMNQVINLSNFYVREVFMPVTGTNRTEAKIEFTPNESEAGSYFVNITVSDKNNDSISRAFNLTIINNNAPQWILPLETNIIIWENNNTYLNLSKNTTDTNGDSLTFSYSSDTSFPSFNLSSAGIINFTLNDTDVGQHLVTVTVNDGYLTNSRVFNITVYNVNDTPYIEKPLQSSDVINATVDSNSNIIAIEDNSTKINLWVQDDDFRIPNAQRSFYNESLTVNLTIQGPNISLFSFLIDSSYAPNPSYTGNRSKYQAIFTPKKSDAGNYNISINLSDRSGKSDFLQFNLTINSIEHNPVLSNLTNQTSAVNRSFYYRINASDAEDGNTSIIGGNSNFTFRYNFTNGTDFINSNWSIFNRTTGELNITFNSSQGGAYRINITVNDTSGREDSKDLYINVYNLPAILYPIADYTFNLNENTSYDLVFRVNHSVQDNLTYNFYVQDKNGNDNLRYSLNYFGNNTNLTWSFTPNISDGTLGVKNLTLVVYPTNSNLANKSNLNLTTKWNITINNTNSILEFINTIGGVYRNLSGGSPYQLILTDYFRDLDAADTDHNQTIGFKVNLINLTSGSILYNVTNWTNGTTPMVYFSAAAVSSGIFSITGYEYNESNLSHILSNITSNNFTISLTITTSTIETPVTTTGGGGGSSVSIITGKTPFAFKIITPGKLSSYTYESIKIPISLINSGNETFKDIDLSVYAYKDGNITNVVKTTFDRAHIESLGPKKYENMSLTVFFETNKTGDYELLINATSKSPAYTDWTKIYVNVQKSNETDLKKYLLFTEEYLVQNPNCLELSEMLKEANLLYESGNFGDARVKAESIVILCKEYVSQTSLPKFMPPIKYFINETTVIISLISFFLGLSYYYFKRRQFERINKLKTFNK